VTGPSLYHLRGDNSDKSGGKMVRTDREMVRVVITDIYSIGNRDVVPTC
jgi:hypothetical protein